MEENKWDTWNKMVDGLLDKFNRMKEEDPDLFKEFLKSNNVTEAEARLYFKHQEEK